MITILIALLISLVLALFFRLKARRVGSNEFKQLGFVVFSISTIYFICGLLFTFIGAESTPIWVTSTNNLNKKIKVYNITVYDHPVYDNISRFVYRGKTLNVGESSTIIIEYDGAVEFWTVGLDDLNKIVFFNVTNSHSESSYKFIIDNDYIDDLSKVKLAIDDIKSYNKNRLTKDILSGFDILLTLILLIEILTSKTKIIT